MKTASATISSPFRLLGLAFAAVITLTPAARGELLVTTVGGVTVRSYHAITGAVIDLSFVEGLTQTQGCFLSGNDLYVIRTGVLDKFNATTGAPVATPLIAGTTWDFGAVSGTDLYLTQFAGNRIAKFTTSGSTQNDNLVTGLGGPAGIVVSGNNVYVANNSGSANTVGRYTTSGAVVNASFISFARPSGLAILDGKLYVASSSLGTVGVFDAETGAQLNPAHITGLSTPFALAIYKGRLYVANNGNGTVGVYDAASGATINATFLSGVTSVYGLAIKPVATPTVRIAGPKTRKVRKPTYRLRGSSTSAASIVVRAGSSRFTLPGNTAWSKTLRLKRGANRISAQATNSEGVSSAVARATLTLLKK